MKLKSTLLALAGLLALALSPVRADDVSDRGRAVFKKYESAIVTVQAVVSVTVSSGGKSSGPNETQAEVTGVVVDPSGLTALALSSVDPSSMAESSRYKLDVEVNDLKILLEDGSEVPAEIVLRDKDRDLGFIRPKTKPAKPMFAIDLANAGSAQVLDQVITINRLGKAAGRAHAASIERISAVVQKPRLFYIPDSMMTVTREGSPAFTLDGKTLGLFVLRTITSKTGSNSRDNVSSIILPADDILKAAKQAPEVRGDAEKKEPAKEEKKDAAK